MAISKQTTIFRLEQLTSCGIRYPRQDVSKAYIGYFSSLEKAEQRMHEYIKERDEWDKSQDEPDIWHHYLGFHITELPVDDNQRTYSYNDQIVSVRSYTPDGKSWDACLTPHDTASKFYGRNPKEIRFRPGDIVEALQGGGCSELGIVDSTPPTTQQYEHYAEKAPQWFFMDYTDDAYTIYYLGDGDTHGHSECTDVFPPSKPVSKSIEKRLRDKLTEMQKLHGDE